MSPSPRERALQEQLAAQALAFRGLKRRSDMTINYLNRALDAAEAEKERLLEEFEASRSMREDDRAQVASLIAQLEAFKIQNAERAAEREEAVSLTYLADRLTEDLKIAHGSVAEAREISKSLEIRLVDERERTMDALSFLAAAENRRLELTTEIEDQHARIQSLEVRQEGYAARESAFRLVIEDMRVRNEQLEYEVEGLKAQIVRESASWQGRVRGLEQFPEKNRYVDQDSATVVHDGSLETSASARRSLAQAQNMLLEEREANVHLKAALDSAEMEVASLRDRLARQIEYTAELEGRLDAAVQFIVVLEEEEKTQLEKEKTQRLPPCADLDPEISEAKDLPTCLAAGFAKSEEDLTKRYQGSDDTHERSTCHSPSRNGLREAFMDALIVSKSRSAKQHRHKYRQLIVGHPQIERLPLNGTGKENGRNASISDNLVKAACVSPRYVKLNSPEQRVNTSLTRVAA